VAAGQELLQRYRAIRGRSLELARPLSAEDQGLQSMPDTSPTKWHLAHTTWFFETLVVAPNVPGYRPVPGFAELFNSYYESLGPRHPRPQRGMLSRPSLAEVHEYREAVDRAMHALIGGLRAGAALCDTIELGLQHEQQHQELLLTDILHAFSLNPLRPAVYEGPAPRAPAGDDGWEEHGGGIVQVGHAGQGFAFDNEGPAHRVFLQPFALARRLVTNAEYRAFVEAGGYRDAQWWLSDGWALAQAWQLPLYWTDDGREFTLHGLQAREDDQPVRHLSFYEAAAYALWAGARLPTEFEWEAAVAREPALPQAFGVAWQWTRSSYDPYPRYHAPAGPVGEYNGKFMVGQLVLRGSSEATPAGHARPTYRNFFPPSARWQYSGLRLARDA
jgi:ergothioneine biosynthesis protein EgtB